MLRLLDAGGEKLQPHREMDAIVRHAHDQSEAERIIKRALDLFQLRPEELLALPKRDLRKLAQARVIRRRTAVPNAWLAGKLAVGHPSRISQRGSNQETAIDQMAFRLEQSASVSVLPSSSAGAAFTD